MGNFIPVEPEKWAEMVKAAAASDYWRIEAETDHARWLRTLEENEKLRADVERLTAQVSYDNRTQLHVDKLAAEFTQCEVEKLKADVDRLRNAGDEMWKVIWLAECIAGVEHTEKSALAWNAAKEGKQS